MRLIGFAVAATAVMALTGCVDSDPTSDTTVEESAPTSDTPIPADDYTGDGLGESPPPEDSSASSSPEVATEESDDEGCISSEAANPILGLSLDVTSLSDGVIRDCFYQDVDNFGWMPVIFRVYSAGHPEVASWQPEGPPPRDNTRGQYEVQPTVVEGKDRSTYGVDGSCSVVTRSPTKQLMAMITVYDDPVSALPGDPCDIGQELADLAETLPPVE